MSTYKLYIKEPYYKPGKYRIVTFETLDALEKERHKLGHYKDTKTFTEDELRSGKKGVEDEG